MVDSIYDEVIKLNTLKGKEEIEKYSIPEEFSKTEKISHILKKGDNLQKSALINNIPKYLRNKELPESLLSNLIEYIEIWDENLQIEFANAILLVFKTYSYKLYYENLRNTYNLIIKFSMKIISTDDKNICPYYINALNQIVSFFNLNGKTRIENDIVDFALNMGNFGKPAVSRRYCVYFCSCILQINEVLNSDIINRFMILSSDTDKIVRQEIAYHMKFLCQELDESYIRKNVLKVIDNYLNDSDFIIRSSIISSILSNIPYKINEDHIISNCVNKIQYLFETESLNIDIKRTQMTVFSCLIREIRRYGTLEKYFNTLIKIFLIKHFLSKEFTHDYNLPFEFLIEELPFVINYYNTDEIGIVDEILVLVTNYVFEHCARQSKEDHTVQSFFKDLALLFITNIIKLLDKIPKQTTNTYITHKMFSLFSYPIIQKETIAKFFTLLTEIFEEQNKQENVIVYLIKDEFFSEFNNSYSKIENFFKFDNDYRNLVLLLSSIHKEGTRLFQRDDFNNKLYIHIKRLLKEENLQVKNECLKLLARLIKYGGKTLKEEVLRYIDLEIVSSKSYYTRRLYFVIFEECLETISLSSLKEKNLIDYLMRLFNENNMFMICKVLSFIPSIYYCIYEELKIMNMINARIELVKMTYPKDVLTMQTLKRTEEFINKFCKEYNYEENQRILENDKNKFDQEIIQMVKEHNDNTNLNVEKKRNAQLEIEEFMKKRGLNRKLLKKTSINNTGSLIKSELNAKPSVIPVKQMNIIPKKVLNKISKSEKKEIPIITNFKSNFLTVATSSNQNNVIEPPKYVKNSNSTSLIDHVSHKTINSIDKNSKQERIKSIDTHRNIPNKSKPIVNFNSLSNNKYQTNKLLKHK